MFRFRQALLVTLLGMGAAALLIFPSEVAAAARESARLAFVSVLPTLFPFLVAAELLISLRVTHSAGRLLGGMMPRLFRQPREAAPVLLLGMLSGYPVGAAAARRLYEEGGCNAEQAERLVALCNNSGPAFVVGVVGAALWNSPRVGWMLYACHIAAALLSGALLAVGSPLPPASRRREVPKAGPLFPAFVSAVKNSAMTCLFIAAFVIFFGVVISLVPTGNGTAGALLSGLLEMTNGVTKTATLTLSPHLRLALQSFLIGAAGLSILCQVASVLDGSGLSLTPYCYGKLLQGAIALLLTLLLYPLFPQEVSVMLPITPELTLSGFALLAAMTVGSFLVSVGIVLVFSTLTEAAIRRKSRGQKRKDF